jgi:hypothetical protein
LQVGATGSNTSYGAADGESGLLTFPTTVTLRVVGLKVALTMLHLKLAAASQASGVS